MKTVNKLRVTVLAIIIVAMLLVAFDLRLSYKGARRLAARDAARFTDSIYAGTRLSYLQIYDPPKFFRLPHWEVTYDSTNPAHRSTRFVTFSETMTPVESVDKR